MLSGFIDVFVYTALAAGYTLGITLLALSILFMCYCVVLIFNRISWYLVDMYGGAKVFKEYIKWYKDKQRNEIKG